jgi:hypothetical protein
MFRLVRTYNQIKGNSNNLSSMCFQSWINYYNKREDKCVKDWNHNIANIQHPIQSLADNHNYGVYVCKISEQYVKNQKHSLQFGRTKKILQILDKQ